MIQRIQALTTRTLTPVLAAIIVCGVGAPASFAQISQIPAATLESRAINTSQRDQINAFVDSLMSDASGDDQIDALDAWNSLVEPLTNDFVSADFRRVYAEALAPVFDTLDNSEHIGATLAALRLSGELATESGIARITQAFSSDDAGVQIFAAGRAGRVLASTARNGAATDESRLSSLVELLGQTAQNTDNHELRGVCVRSLGMGGSLPSRDFRSLRGRSIELMSTISAHTLRDATDETLQDAVSLAVQSASTATAALSKVGEDATPNATKGAVELSSHMIAKVLKRVVTSQIAPVGARMLDTTLLQAGESLLYFSLRENAEIRGGSSGNVRQTALAPMLEIGEDRDFRNAAALLIGAGSPIVRDFGFKDDEFVN